MTSSVPALSFEAPHTHRRQRKVRTAAEFQRAAAEWELCCCPACIAVHPERRLLLIRRRTVLKSRFLVED